MKVGLVLDDSLDRPDGVQQYVITLGSWLAGQGHQVHYLVGETHRQDLANIHSLSTNYRAHFNKNRLSIPGKASGRAIAELLNQLQLDVLHVQLPYHPLLGGQIIKRAPSLTAVVGTFHIMPGGLLARGGTRTLGTLQTKSLARFDDIIAVSEPARRFAASHYHQSISGVIPNMINSTSMQTSRPVRLPHTKHIVFLGRLVDRKGCQYLLKAITQLAAIKQTPKFTVTIGGTGPLQPKLAEFVKQHKLENIVQFAGFIDEQDKPKFLAQADIAVFPSTTGESFGIVLIEAMAAGAGVVMGGNNPGYISVLGSDQPTLFDPKQTPEFAELLHRLLTDTELSTRLHTEQQSRVKQFDVGVVGKQITAFYEAAIAKRKHSTDNTNK